MGYGFNIKDLLGGEPSQPDEPRVAAQPTQPSSDQAPSFPVFGRLIEQPEQKVFGRPIDVENSLTKSLGHFGKGVAKLAGVPGDLVQLAEAVSPSIGGASAFDVFSKVIPGMDIISTAAKEGLTSEGIGTLLEKMGAPKRKGSGVWGRFLEDLPMFLPDIMTGGLSAIGKGGLKQAGKTAVKGELKNIGKASGPIRSFVNKYAKVFVPPAVSAATEEAELPPWAQAVATAGSSLLTRRLGAPSLKEMNTAEYKKLDKLYPGTNKIKVDNLDKGIATLERDLSKGIQTQDKSAVLKVIRDLRRKMTGNRMSAQDVVQAKQDLRYISSFADDLKNPRAKKLIKRLVSNIQSDLKVFGEKHPEWYRTLKNADSVHAGLSQLNGMWDFVKQSPKLYKGIGLISSIAFPMQTVTVGGLAAGGYVANTLMKNPGLVKLYWRVMKDIAKKDSGAAIKSIKAFNESFKKKDPETYKKLYTESPNQ